MQIENPCIYCGGIADSREHPLIAALGEFENAPMLDDRICRTCNTERLGILDEQYVRCGPEGFLRRHYGVQGRPARGREVNPFYRGSAGGQRIEVLAFDANLGVEVLMEGEGGNYRQARQLVFISKSGDVSHFPIADGITATQLREQVNRLDLPKDVAIHLIAGPEEWDSVSQVVREAWPQVAVSGGEPMSNTYNGVAATFTLTDRYFRAVAKIGFHYFLTQFTELRGDEPQFADIRHFIVEDGGKVDRANEFVTQRNHPLLGELLPAGAHPVGWRAHVLAAEIKDGRCRAHIQTFLTEDWPAPAYTVTLGAAPPSADRGAGHIYLYYSDGRHGRFSGEAMDLTASRLTIAVPPSSPVVRA